MPSFAFDEAISQPQGLDRALKGSRTGKGPVRRQQSGSAERAADAGSDRRSCAFRNIEKETGIKLFYVPISL